jgi:hypothetical protein
MTNPEGSPKEDDDQSDVELEGMDMEGVEDEDDADGNNDVEMDGAVANDADAKSDENDTEALQAEDAEELEAAKRERMELLAAEKRKAAGGHLEGAKTLDPRDRFDFLVAQSDVFAHFLAGSVAATGKKGKKGSRGKKGRMTEAEEDAQLLKTLESKRRTVRLEIQPGILAPTCTMRKYQLEGLNWMIKLHDSGINGILADEVRFLVVSRMRMPSRFNVLFYWPRYLLLPKIKRWDLERHFSPFRFWLGIAKVVESGALISSLSQNPSWEIGAESSKSSVLLSRWYEWEEPRPNGSR